MQIEKYGFYLLSFLRDITRGDIDYDEIFHDEIYLQEIYLQGWSKFSRCRLKQIRHFRISTAQILRWVMLLYTWVWQSRRNSHSFYSAGLSKVKIRASLCNKAEWSLFIIAWRSPNFDFRWSILYSRRKTYDNVPFGSMTLIWCLFFCKF